MPQDNWDAEASREIARSAVKRPPTGFYGAVPDAEPTDRPSSGDEPGEGEEELEEIPVAPVRRQLSLAIAGFAGLLGLALVLGAHTSAPDSRWPFALVLFGVQVLYLLAGVMALGPPAAATTGGVAVVVALAADYLAVSSKEAALLPLLWVALAGWAVALAGQLFKAEDRARVTDAWRTTGAIVVGVAAYAIPIVLTRQSIGTQAVIVCATAGGVTLLVARAADALFPKPRIAAQVPRGVTGVVLGAMLGTLAAAGLGSVLVLPFTPAKGAVIGLIAAVIANLVDLAVNFGQAGRRLAGDAPTFWLARHMQGPLGAFALISPVAYMLTHWYLG
jgi:hypothetical protein